MKDHRTIIVEKTENIITIWLNRPEVHNAMNELMIEELTDVFTSTADEEIRAVLLLAL